ncbi:hypothetical protein F5146DRAFT_1130549 [Armillaria mellea]|nr:hypothetical protein F5146DRAFT_1130549 [Armillaria mellea]
MFGISGRAQESFTPASSITELAYTIRTTPSNSEPVSSILLVQSNVDIPVSDIFTLIFFSTSSTNLVLVQAMKARNDLLVGQSTERQLKEKAFAEHFKTSDINAEHGNICEEFSVAT